MIVDLRAHRDGVDLDVDVVERRVQGVARDAGSVIGAVGKHDQGSEAQWNRGLAHLAVKDLDRLDHGAIEIRRGILGLESRERAQGALRIAAAEGNDLRDVWTAIEGKNAELLVAPHPLGKRRRAGHDFVQIW